MASSERTLCVDPGEETGWSLWRGAKLLGGGQTKLGQFKFDFWKAVSANEGPLSEGQDFLLHAGVKKSENKGPITRIIIEKFALYPDKAKSMAWDEFRTVQLIGALVFIAELFDIEVVKQPASIKKTAEAAGAAELFVRPLHENRHQNDSIMHGVFYNIITAKGKIANIPDMGKGS